MFRRLIRTLAALFCALLPLLGSARASINQEGPSGRDGETTARQPATTSDTANANLEPIVARIDLTLRLKGEVIDTIHKGDLLNVIAERENDYVIVTFAGKKGAIAKENAAKLIEAVSVYDELILQTPDEGRLYTLRASTHWAQGNTEKALADFDQAIQLGYQEAHAYASRGLFYSSVGEHEKAVQDFSTAIEKDSADEVALMNRASVYLTLGEFEKAIDDYTSALAIRSENPVLYSQRAVANKLAGKLDKAIEDYDKTIDLVPQDISAWMGRGYVKFQAGQFQAAVEDFARVIELAPQSAVAYNNRGYNLQMLKRYSEALEDYQRAVELAPGYILALQNQAWLLTVCENKELRDPVTAMEAAKKVNEASQFAEISDLTLLAATFAEAGDFETAIGWQEKALELAKDEEKTLAQKILDLYHSDLPIDASLLEAKP